jgi:type VI secretion system protein ImpC
LRAVLSAPAFRALEGAWRGVDRLVRTLGTDAELRISLLDASRRDLLDAVSGGPDGNLEGSTLHRLLVADDRRFSLAAVDLDVALAGDDVRLCAALGAVVGRGGGALVAGAAPSLLGCDTLDALADPTQWRSPEQAPDGALWRALRESPIAPSIGLALPRVLARLPYGKKTDPIESFPFEEVGPRTGRAPDARVWSPAAFAIAEAYGAAFRAGGWEMDPSGSRGPFDLEDLPTHTYDDAGETRLFPPAEAVLGERAGAAIVASGLTAILARRDRGAARILGAASIATPAAPLAGPWVTRD